MEQKSWLMLAQHLMTFFTDIVWVDGLFTSTLVMGCCHAVKVAGCFRWSDKSVFFCLFVDYRVTSSRLVLRCWNKVEDGVVSCLGCCRLSSHRRWRWVWKHRIEEHSVVHTVIMDWKGCRGFRHRHRYSQWWWYFGEAQCGCRCRWYWLFFSNI